MAIVNYSVPDEVKAAFNETFAHQNKSSIIAGLMREAVERKRRRDRSNEAILRILTRRDSAPEMSDEEFRRDREEGRS